VAAAVIGLVVGWALAIAPWPVAVLWADELIVFSALWLAWAAWSMRRASGQRAATANASHAPLPLPRLTVVLWQMLPWIAYGSAFFAAVFAGPLLALDPATRALWNAGVTALLVAMGAAERGRRRFAEAVDEGMRATKDLSGDRLRRGVGDVHAQAAAVTAGVFAIVAAVASVVVLRSVPLADISTLTMIGFILGGYVLVSVGATNAALLFTAGRAWTATWTFIAGLIPLVAAGLLNAFSAASIGTPLAFVVTGVVVAAVSTLAVRRAVRGLDHVAAHAFSWQ
jgi:hypothetical protein